MTFQATLAIDDPKLTATMFDKSPLAAGAQRNRYARTIATDERHSHFVG